MPGLKYIHVFFKFFNFLFLKNLFIYLFIFLYENFNASCIWVDRIAEELV